jgi:hypothetical protein
MINLIGAYITTLLLLALLKARPSPKKMEMTLRTLSLWAAAGIALCAALVILHTALGWFESWPPVSIVDLLLSGLDFWIHEAGHIYFCWGGELLHSFGGTLTQMLFTLVPAVWCFTRSYTRLAAVFLWWFGHHAFGIGRYVADARSKKLDLVGGGPESHDWGTILGKLGLLNYDQFFGSAVLVIAWLAVLGAYLLFFMPGDLRTEQTVPTHALKSRRSMPDKKQG